MGNKYGYEIKRCFINTRGFKTSEQNWIRNSQNVDKLINEDYIAFNKIKINGILFM